MIKYSDEDVNQAINRLCQTKDGQLLVAWLKDACRWDAILVSSEKPEVTQFYAAQRGVYSALRDRIKKEYLKEIEFNFERAIKDGRVEQPKPTSRKPSDRAKSKRNTTKSE